MVAIPQICYNSVVTCLDRPSDRAVIKKSEVMQNFWGRLHDDSGLLCNKLCKLCIFFNYFLDNRCTF